jgi:hypothetical protein
VELFRALHRANAVAANGFAPRQPAVELKLDGYRAIASKRDGFIHLRSRNDIDFSGRYPGVVKGLAKMPDDTVIDGEVIDYLCGRRILRERRLCGVAAASTRPGAGTMIVD